MKKVGLLALAIVLSLGLMGAGLAYWTETLTITGSVATGNLSVAYSNVVCADNESNPDVGTCSATITGENTDSETLVITITNAYPCYTCTVDFDILNDGSIPVDLGSLVLDLSGLSGELDVTVSVETTANDLAVDGVQAGQLTIHVTDVAAESSTYTFTATIVATQFNA